MNMPILTLNDWEEMNEKFLYDTFMEWSHQPWNWEKLTFEYWKREICGN